MEDIINDILLLLLGKVWGQLVSVFSLAAIGVSTAYYAKSFRGVLKKYSPFSWCMLVLTLLFLSLGITSFAKNTFLPGNAPSADVTAYIELEKNNMGDFEAINRENIEYYTVHNAGCKYDNRLSHSCPLQ